MRTLAASLALILSTNHGAWAQSNSHNPSLAPVLKQVLPAVVNIAVLGQSQPDANTARSSGNNPYQPKSGHKFQSVGSGIIIDAEQGLVVTNAHVVHNAKVIVMMLQDGRRLSATKIGADPASDIALLKVKAKNLHAIQFAPSEHVEVGDFVAAIGNPFGLHHSVTSGMVSALHRNDLRIEGYEDFIQTDAPINPGNSGGALINMQGDMVGMNTAIIGPDGANIGIGFAIPSDMIQSVVTQLLTHGSVERGMIGVMVQALSPTLATALHTTQTQGAIVTEIQDGSPAQKVGIHVNDIIYKAGNHTITGPATLKNAVGLTRTDDTIELTIERKQKTVRKSIRPMSLKKMEAFKEQHNNNPLSGAQMAAIDELTANGRHIQGVLTIGIDYTSAAWFAGLRAGDIILQANHQDVSSVQQLWTITQAAKKDIILKVHHGADRFIVIPRHQEG